ncbi:MAG: hypothetical protein K8S99_17290 [Planctomycetes bacterium]|nr:hypothetical protein [Planctomycetota bacterium]
MGNWFTRFCRNAGLMVHNIIDPGEEPRKRVVSKTVEEKKVDETVTLRRTTIDEVIVRKQQP